MKAKLVENIDFKRGMGTKGSLDIGGLKIEEIHEDIFSSAIKEWGKFKESLIGKKISGYFFDTNSIITSPQKMVINVSDVQVIDAMALSIIIKSQSTKKWWKIDHSKKIFFL